MGFRKLRDENFDQNIAKGGTASLLLHNGRRNSPALNDGDKNTAVTIIATDRSALQVVFKKSQSINCVVLRENLVKGQSCEKFTVRLLNEKRELLREISGTTIGHKRILTFPQTDVSVISVSVDEQKSPTAITETEAYLINDKLIEN